MKKVLITGGSGLVGKYVARDLSADYEVAVADKKEPDFDVKFFKVDVTRGETFSTIGESFDVVLHLAGIPTPLNDPQELVFEVNTLGTFNTLQFAASREIKKVILASSESVLGFAFARQTHVPLYFPIDEQHPLEPQDAYGLSKVCAEEALKSFSRAYGIHTIALRFPWIWVPEDKERQMYRQLISDYPKWFKNLWAWVHVHDVSQAFGKAIEFKNEDFDRFFIVADENWTGFPATELARKFYRDVQIVRSLDGPKSLISNDLARVVLRFSPSYKVADIFE